MGVNMLKDQLLQETTITSRTGGAKKSDYPESRDGMRLWPLLLLKLLTVHFSGSQESHIYRYCRNFGEHELAEALGFICNVAGVHFSCCCCIASFQSRDCWTSRPLLPGPKAD